MNSLLCLVCPAIIIILLVILALSLAWAASIADENMGLK